MKYERLICVDTNGDDKLSINNEYRGIKHDSFSAYYNYIYTYLYDKKEYLGIFPSRIFKTVKQVRQQRLNDVLNEI